MTLIEEIESFGRSVYAELGSGHSESVYQRAMEVELRLKGKWFESQQDVAVRHRGCFVGRGIIDLVVGEWIIELKAVAGKIGEAESQQVRNYMTLTGVKHGVVINFGQPGAAKAGEFSMLVVA